MENVHNVLLVEPKQCDREVLPILLKKLGFTTYVAECLKDAFFILEDSEKWQITSVIISDETLDKKHLNFIKWIKSRHKEIKTIAISCRSSDSDACKALNIFHLRKPIIDCSAITTILKDDDTAKISS